MAQHISKLLPSMVSPTVTMFGDFRKPPTIRSMPAALHKVAETHPDTMDTASSRPGPVWTCVQCEVHSCLTGTIMCLVKVMHTNRPGY